MKGEIHYQGQWRIPYKATGVMCSDGVQRTVRLNGLPDTVFSIPGVDGRCYVIEEKGDEHSIVNDVGRKPVQVQFGWLLSLVLLGWT